jgi:hypothetical protein
MRLLLALVCCCLVLGAGCTRDTTPAKKPEQEAAMDPNSPEYLSFKADIPIYPNSRLPDNKSNVRSDGEQTRIELIMLSSDSPTAVASFYVEKLKLERTKEGDKVRLMGKTPKGNYAIIDLQKQGADTKIAAVAIVMGE